MKRLLPFAALLVLVGGAPAEAPSSAASQAVRRPIPVTSGSGPATRLFRADPVSLKRVGRRSLRLGFGLGTFARSPNGALLALSRTDRPAVQLVRLRTLRFSGEVPLPQGCASLEAWPSPRLLLGLCWTPSAQLVAIDPEARIVLWRRPLPARVDVLERAPGGVVALSSPEQGIGPATVTFVGDDGSVRSVELERISAGSRVDLDAEHPIAEQHSPGLAVNPGARTAYVVGAGGAIAEIELGSMSVAYRGASRALAKTVGGWSRQALWLGNGRLAVVGTDSAVSVGDGERREMVTPAGLVLFDTRTGTARMVQRSASAAIARAGSLFAFGAGYDSASGVLPGAGLTAYDLAGRRRFHRFGRLPVPVVQAERKLAYARLVARDGNIAVVDAARGRILKTVTRPEITLLTRD